MAQVDTAISWRQRKSIDSERAIDGHGGRVYVRRHRRGRASSFLRGPLMRNRRLLAGSSLEGEVGLTSEPASHTGFIRDVFGAELPS